MRKISLQMHRAHYSTVLRVFYFFVCAALTRRRQVNSLQAKTLRTFLSFSHTTIDIFRTLQQTHEQLAIYLYLAVARGNSTVKLKMKLRKMVGCEDIGDIRVDRRRSQKRTKTIKKTHTYAHTHNIHSRYAIYFWGKFPISVYLYPVAYRTIESFHSDTQVVPINVKYSTV